MKRLLLILAFLGMNALASDQADLIRKAEEYDSFATNQKAWERAMQYGLSNSEQGQKVLENYHTELREILAQIDEVKARPESEKENETLQHLYQREAQAREEMANFRKELVAQKFADYKWDRDREFRFMNKMAEIEMFYIEHGADFHFPRATTISSSEEYDKIARFNYQPVAANRVMSNVLKKVINSESIDQDTFHALMNSEGAWELNEYETVQMGNMYDQVKRKYIEFNPTHPTQKHVMRPFTSDAELSLNIVKRYVDQDEKNLTHVQDIDFILLDRIGAVKANLSEQIDVYTNYIESRKSRQEVEPLENDFRKFELYLRGLKKRLQRIEDLERKIDPDHLELGNQEDPTKETSDESSASTTPQSTEARRATPMSENSPQNEESSSKTSTR